MRGLKVEKTNEFWTDVLAQEKMPALMRLGYVPENLWNSKIRTACVAESDGWVECAYVQYKAEFVWEIDHICYTFETKIPLHYLTGMPTKKELFNKIQDTLFLLHLDDELLNYFEFLHRVDDENPIYSAALDETIKHLVARVFVEVYNTSIRNYSDLI